MADIEKIQGVAVLKLFKELQQDDIPLKMQLTNYEYEHLTHITKIRKWKKEHYFLIEYHDNFPIAADDLEGWRMRFEFACKDNINYAFETGTGRISHNMLWIRLPEIVHRHQRRGYFRMEAPHGTRLFFNINDTRYSLLVINISLGGTLGVLVSLTKKMELELYKKAPQMLKHVELIFPTKNDNGQSKVNIKQCKIKRQQINPQTKRHECAIEFKEIAPDQQKKLTRLFYQWQRDYLKKRRLFKV